MADPILFSFDLKEVTEALIKQQGLTTGVWALGVEFNFQAVAAGTSPEEVKPSILVQVNRLQLVEAPSDSPVGTHVDAAKLTSREKPTQKRKRQLRGQP